MKPTLVLSVDAGGVRSPIIASTILQRLEENLGERSNQIFDLFTGTSGGAIVAASSSVGMSGVEMYHNAVNLADRAFKRGFFHKVRSGNGLIGDRYPKGSLMGVLKDTFGKMLVTDVPKPLCIPITDLINNESIVMKSHKENRHSDLKLLKDTVYSSSAAPRFFPLFKGRYADGGLFAYSPVLVGYAEAKKIWNERPVIILSIGSGFAETPERIPNRNPLVLLRKLVEGALESQIRSFEYIVDKIPDAYSFRIEPYTTAGLDDTDQATLDRLVETAKKWYPVVDDFSDLISRI